MKQTSFPSLDDLIALDALARTGSIKEAGVELSLTHGAVSRRISRISETLGKSVTEPAGRGVRLTQAGQILAKATGDAFTQINLAIREIRDNETRALVLSCERSIAARWLIPRLNEYQELFPNDPVHLSVGGGHLDFKKEGVDLALRRIDFPIKPSWSVTKLADEAMGAVVSPDKISEYKCGNYLAFGSKTREKGWEQWLKEHPAYPKPLEIRFLDHHFLVAEAAVAGLGVGFVPKLVALDALKNKQLLAPHGFNPDGSIYGLITPTDRNEHPSLEQIQDWLTQIV